MFVRRLVKELENVPLTRANRALHIDWLYQETNLIAYAELSESVFGHEIYKGQAWPIKAPYSQNIILPEDIITLLEKEETSLDQQAAPRVASIYGAWAYLDKGRAWGLKVNDRVYIETAEKKVKGRRLT